MCRGPNPERKSPTPRGRLAPIRFDPKPVTGAAEGRITAVSNTGGRVRVRVRVRVGVRVGVGLPATQLSSCSSSYSYAYSFLHEGVVCGAPRFDHEKLIAYQRSME